MSTSVSINTTWQDSYLPLLYDWYDEYPYDLDMWHTLCTPSKGPILDLGCGTGRVAIDLARKSFEVVGLDLSQSMIARAQEKLGLERQEVRDRVCFEIADMSAFNLGRTFPMVLIPCFSFHELTTSTTQKSCLESIHRHLTADGTLVLALGFWKEDKNVLPPEEPVDLGEPMEEGLNPNTGLLTRMWSRGWCNPSIQTKYHRFYFEEYDTNGTLVRKSTYPNPPQWHARRFLGRYEAEWLLRDCSFAVERIYGNWDMSELNSQSQCMIILAKRQ